MILISKHLWLGSILVSNIYHEHGIHSIPETLTLEKR